MKKLIILLPLILLVSSCQRTDSSQGIPLDRIFSILSEIDPNLSFERRTGITEIYGGSSGYEKKECDFYVGTKEWEDIKLTIYSRTYNSPTIFSNGSLEVVFPKGSFSTNREKIQKITEEYIFAFASEFVQDDELKKELLDSAYEYKPDNYVSSAHTQKMGPYLVDLYFKRDSAHWKTHDAIIFSVERGIGQASGGNG